MSSPLFPTPARLVLASALIAVTAAAQGGPEVAARLFADPVVDGSKATIALAVEVSFAPGWHVYYDGQNDSGEALSVTWALPEGLVVSGPRWPAPQRKIQGGSILDHVYEKRVTLLYEASGEVPKDRALEIRGTLRWFSCSDVCTLGEEEISVRWEPSGLGPRPDDAARARIESARAAIPPEVRAPVDAIRLEWSEDGAVVRVAGARLLRYFPHSTGTPVPDLLSAGEAEGDVLGLRFAKDAKRPRRLFGILEAEAGEKEPVRRWTLAMIEPEAVPR